MKLFCLAIAMAFSGAACAEWQYEKDADAMTGKSSARARMQSDNSLDLDFPYKGANFGYLQVRQHPRYGLDVIFSINKGQLMCPSYSGCSVMVKFDDKPPVRFNATGPEDNSTTVIFLGNAPRFIAEAQKAKRILVQPTIYHAGAPVLTFTTGKPLEWASPKAVSTPAKKGTPAAAKELAPAAVEWPAVPAILNGSKS